MENKEFKAFVIEEIDGNFKREIKTRHIEDLPQGDLLVKVHFSSLNYKDALSATGNKGVTKKYPHTPGVDTVGTVVEDRSGKFKTGDNVIVTCYDLGMNTDGGYAEYIRVPSEWAFKLPSNMTMKEAMTFGTGGFTAALSVLRLTERVKPEDGDIIVSGATGGVGSFSVAILSKLGYHVIAITGKESQKEYLKTLGAENIILRKDFEQLPNKPLLKSAYAGGIDTVGGVILENIIKSVKQEGTVTCCGNAASADLNLTVYPFILRGLSLLGIDAQSLPIKERELTWNKIADELKPYNLSDIATEVSLEGLSEKIDLILKGKMKGRVIVNLNK